MIRQTITCDTCGIERKQANHWFEAFEHEGELRIRGLIPTKTTRPGLRHLCGQTCLHRLVDDFLAGNLKARMFGPQEDAKAPTDFAELVRMAEPSSDDDFHDFESSARLIVNSEPVAATRPSKPKKTPAPRPPKSGSPTPDRVFAKQADAADLPTKLEEELTPPAIPAAPAAPLPSAPSAPTPARVGQSLLSGARRPVPPTNGVPLSMSAPGDGGALLEPPSSLTPQARRAMAWERERARVRLSANANLKNGKIEKFF